MIIKSLIVAAAFASELLNQHVARPLDAESTMEALRPWETPVEGFFVRSHFDTPATDPSQWTLVIDGMVEHPLTVTLADLRRMPSSSLHAILECSGNGRGQQLPHVPGVQWVRGAVGNAGWQGVPLQALLKKAGVKAGAKYVTVTGADKPGRPEVPGFIRSISLAKAETADTLLAYQMNGQPLPLPHGGPVRLVLPHWYGENWTKWVTHLTVTDAEDQGFYMKKGYRMPRQPVKPGEKWDPATGVPVEQLLVQSLIVSPVEGDLVQRGELTLYGKTFSGAGTITRVDVSTDDGKTWSEAKLEPPHADGGWQEFSAKVAAPQDGPLTLMSRATDSAGNQQPLTQTWNPSGYLRNAADRLVVTVGPASSANGRDVLAEKCTICHAREMVESQRLTPAQWQATIEKMRTVYGAQVNDAEQKALLGYVTRFSPDLLPADPVPTVYGTAVAALTDAGATSTKAGNVKHGAALFKTQCAVCHGPEGDGLLGPRIRHRALGELAFRSAVLNGKRTMPPFAAQLKLQDIADLRAFLQNPK